MLRLFPRPACRPRLAARVTYLAQVDRPPMVRNRGTAISTNIPCASLYARPGGPKADLAWAAARLAERGMAMTSAPIQVRTWNLSSLWRLPCANGVAWLKVVPPFFAHEGALITHLAGDRVPTLLAHDRASHPDAGRDRG